MERIVFLPLLSWLDNQNKSKAQKARVEKNNSSPSITFPAAAPAYWSDKSSKNKYVHRIYLSRIIGIRLELSFLECKINLDYVLYLALEKEKRL